MENKYLTESQINEIFESNKNNPEWWAVYGYGLSYLPRKEQERYPDKTKNNYREFAKELCTIAIIEEMNSINNKESDFYIILSEILESRK